MRHDCPAEGGGVKEIARAWFDNPAQWLGGLDDIRVADINSLEKSKVDGLIELGVKNRHERSRFFTDRLVATKVTQGDQSVGKPIGAPFGLGDVAEVAQRFENTVGGRLRQPTLGGEFSECQWVTRAGEHLNDRKCAIYNGDAHVFALQRISQCETTIPSNKNLSVLIDCHNHLGVDLFFYLNGYHPYAQDLPALVTEGRHCGVDRWVVFPFVANLNFEVGAMRAGKLALGGIEPVPYAFENERMLREIYELYPDLGQQTLPFVILDPERAPAAQIARLRELYREFPFYGLKIQATMIESDVRALLTTGRGFLELAAEWDVPFLIHSSVAPEDRWSQASAILEVAAATPHVRFCLAHSCRFDRACLDRVAELPNTWFDCSAHRIHCEGVTRGLGYVAPVERRFPADYRDPAAVLAALAAAYPEKLIWGSDTPFQSYVAKLDGTFTSLRSTYAEEVACVRALSPKVQDAVGRTNLLALLRLKNDRRLSLQ